MTAFNQMSNWENNKEKIILIDNGAFEIKHSTAGSKTFKRFHNAKFFEKSANSSTALNLSSPYFIEDISNDFDKAALSSISKNYVRPLSRGLLSDIDLQLDIWEKIFQTHYSMEAGDDTFKENMLIFTHTPLAPDEIIEGYFEIIFEYFNFDACFKAIPQVFSSIFYQEKYKNQLNNKVQLAIDSGFTSTTIVPLFDNLPIYNAIKRVEIGGKLLTNYLKECLVNTIDLDLRKEFYLVNLIKEESCFVSTNFNMDMKFSKESDFNNKTFILPEYRNKGESFFNKESNREKYMIQMNNLRYVVPELIFHPDMIGVEEGGLIEGIMQSVNECHSDYKSLLLENITSTGGNSKMKGFNERVKSEVNSNVDHDLVKDVKIFNEYAGGQVTENSNYTISDKNEPVIQGMQLFAQNTSLIKDVAITKQEYDDIGFNIVWKTCY